MWKGVLRYTGMQLYVITWSVLIYCFTGCVWYAFYVLHDVLELRIILGLFFLDKHVR